MCMWVICMCVVCPPRTSKSAPSGTNAASSSGQLGTSTTAVDASSRLLCNDGNDSGDAAPTHTHNTHSIPKQIAPKARCPACGKVTTLDSAAIC